MITLNLSFLSILSYESLNKYKCKCEYELSIIKFWFNIILFREFWFSYFWRFYLLPQSEPHISFCDTFQKSIPIFLWAFSTFKLLEEASPIHVRQWYPPLKFSNTPQFMKLTSYFYGNYRWYFTVVESNLGLCF